MEIMHQPVIWKAQIAIYLDLIHEEIKKDPGTDHHKKDGLLLKSKFEDYPDHEGNEYTNQDECKCPVMCQMLPKK